MELSTHQYPATLTPNGEGGFTVAFRDMPEALTEIHSMDELEETASDCLATAVEFYIEDRKPFPLPSKARDGERLVVLPKEAAVKAMLLNEEIGG